MFEGALSEHTVYDWFNLYRDIMSKIMVDIPLRLGGPGEIVEIDESLWAKKQKYHVGNVGRRAPWILGMIERSTGRVVLRLLDSRCANDILPVITEHVLPHTTIYTDCWAAYNNLPNIPNMHYTHQTVNHTENFVDPVTGVHTQTIEGFWGNAKDLIKKMHGVKEARLVPYVEEIVFRWNHRNDSIFLKLVELLGYYYCPNHQVTADKLNEMPQLQYD